jgi:2-aminoethylphosphonate-pyruvate transaminase
MQGSASLALEIMTLNFLYGRILVINTGYYSDRLQWLAESAARRGVPIKDVSYADHENAENITGKFDWLLACPTETSRGLKTPISKLGKLAKKLGARLMLDATASIGLEEHHELADVIAYSSCKGLFGLTGACFIAFNTLPENTVDSFYLKLETHLNKSMTGPYHAITSLADVLPRHNEFRAAVVANKKRFSEEMSEYLTLPQESQPLLCTHVSCQIKARDPKAVLYNSRGNIGGSIVCHLGEAHLGSSAKGDILNAIYPVNPEKEK